MKMIPWLIAILVQAGSLLADDDSARRYASLTTDPVMYKFCLLSTKPVQAHLKLTQKQIKSLKSFMRGQLIDTTPGLAELRRSKEQKLYTAS